ncbi:amidohydrolase family protein [Brevundimonas diminuta]|uniref:amidohydrolase family protein n=1 Tax=Brevundimonas diminuta TaxID=293 RepID=UPI003208D2BE
MSGSRILRLLCVGSILVGLGAPMAADAETVAVVNARVVSLGPEGDLERGVVVVRDGRIAEVGRDIAVPMEARVIDGEGMILTPGLVAAITPLGLNDTIGSGWGGLGSTAPDLGAGFDVLADVNPNSPQIPEARIEGVTRAVLAPNAPGRASDGSARLFGGQASVIHLGQGYELTVRPVAAVVMNAGAQGAAAAGGGRGALLTRLAQVLDLVRAYDRNPRAFDRARLEHAPVSELDLQALVPVTRGERPLMVEVERASDIVNMLNFAEQQDVRLILSGAAEGWMVADRIAAAGVPVVLNGEDNQAFTFDSLNATYDNAAILSRAGVKIAFKPSVARIVFLIRTPRFIAGRAVRHGLSWNEAMEAVTINPAVIFGFADRFGSIEPGKDADLVLWSGDPLETSSVARMVMIRGVEQPLTARNRALRDRYIGRLTAD